MIFRCAYMTQPPTRSQIEAGSGANSSNATGAAPVHTTNSSSVLKQPDKQEPTTEGKPTAVGSAGFAGANAGDSGRIIRDEINDLPTCRLHQPPRRLRRSFVRTL